MSHSSSASRSPSILVVDDDRRVVELLSIALTAYGYRVLQAGDGEEALHVAARERPDLVVLDVRLPKKSGFDVCERLRQDPEDPDVPIIMVSAAAETESRLQGLARGADDYVAKPFSPKELIARIKRLLARAAESRDARRRGLEAEQELDHAREDAKRSHTELRSEQRLRALTHAFVRDFHGMLDVERLAGRLLLAAQSLLGVEVTALFCARLSGETLGVTAVRGELFERLAGLEIRPQGELATLLQGLGRPVRLRELERFEELRGEIAPLVAVGFTVLAPLRGPEGMEGLLAAAERLDGRDLGRPDLDVLAVLCETAAPALHNARRCRGQAEGLLDALAAAAGRLDAPADQAREEAAAWIERPARALLPPREHALLARAIRFGRWAQSADGGHALALAAERDPSGWCAEFLRLIDAARDRGAAAMEDASPEERRAAALLRAGLAYAHARARGLRAGDAAAAALADPAAALDESVRAVLSTGWPLGEAGETSPATARP